MVRIQVCGFLGFGQSGAQDLQGVEHSEVDLKASRCVRRRFATAERSLFEAHVDKGPLDLC